MRTRSVEYDYLWLLLTQIDRYIYRLVPVSEFYRGECVGDREHSARKCSLLSSTNTLYGELCIFHIVADNHVSVVQNRTACQKPFYNRETLIQTVAKCLPEGHRRFGLTATFYTGGSVQGMYSKMLCSTHK
jgi:hypothetical protein